jgi:hypothetical protein
VPVVHHAGQALRRVAAHGLGVLACAAALGGCLGGSGSSEPTSGGAGADLGQTVRTADCAGWRRAGPQERKSTIDAVKGFAGGPTGTGDRNGATLPDSKAYDIFEGTCRQSFATRFKLYKLYTRAAAFQNIPKR